MVDYLENGFQKLQDSSDCHSLLKKHLTREVLDQLKGKKTEQFGSTLKDVVQSDEELSVILQERGFFNFGGFEMAFPIST